LFNTDGANGLLYKARDLHRENSFVIVKFQNDQQMNEIEFYALRRLNMSSFKGTSVFPKLYGGGIINEGSDGQRLSYIVIELLGKTLEHYLHANKKAFSLKTVC
jgi:hypothetical protein